MIKKAKKTNSKKSQNHTGVLVLENKKVFKGTGIGYQGEATGEVCFNTSLTGYQEIISDPSYAGQIINFTFPHIGNVGTNKEDIESDKIWTRGVIFNSEISSPSNYRAFLHLDAWLKKNRIVGIVSERDIIKLLSGQSNKEIFSKKIKYIMTKNVITCDIKMRSDELMMIMSKNKIRHIPIKKNDKLLGMVSIGDVVSRLVEKYQKEAKLLREFISM